MKFYKYYSFNKNSLEQLIKQQLRFSGIEKFNDPFEFKFNVDIEYINLLTEDKKNYKKMTSDEYKKDLEQSLSEVGVCCLSNSKQPDNILMWSHYTEGHKGFVLEVDFEKVGDTRVREVKYEKERVTINKDTIKNNNQIENKILVTKFIDWEYENEWRVIVKKKNQLYGSKNITFTRVIFGSNMKPKDKDTIRRIMGEGFPYSEAILSETEYKININPC